MKKIFCILSLVFGALCLLCGICYGVLLVMELSGKLKAVKKEAIKRIKDYVLDE